MLNQCYAVYSQFEILPFIEIKTIYRFTTDKKTAKRLVKHLKKQGMRKSDFVEINPTDYAILIYRNETGLLPFIIAKGLRYRQEAEHFAESFRQVTNLNVSIQKFDEAVIFETSQQEGLLGKGAFYA